MPGWRRKVGPEFNRAANELSAWREREKAALNERTRALFARIREETDRKKREASQKFWKDRERMVEQEKSKLLLQRPGAALKMFPSRMLRESIAYHKAADMVRRRHQDDLQTIERDGEKREDEFLKEQEQGREQAARKMREEFRERSLAAEMREARERERDDRSR